jgi:tetratricopeptide (TPR) repeat protein
MTRELLAAVAALLVASGAAAQILDRPADNRTVLGAGTDYLSAGAEAIRLGDYDEGIRLTTMGLRRGASTANRAAGLSNLCAAHAAKNEPDLAIAYCTESLAINNRNWRAYSNRSYAYYLKGLLPQAYSDLRTATEINPSARQLAIIQGMINERNLRPSVTMEEHR